MSSPQLKGGVGRGVAIDTSSLAGDSEGVEGRVSPSPLKMQKLVNSQKSSCCLLNLPCTSTEQLTSEKADFFRISIRWERILGSWMSLNLSSWR